MVESLLFALLISAQAQNNSASLKIDNVQEKTSPAEDVDLIITNPKMRAETGSKSKFSIATAFTYNAGSAESPFGEVRPNVTGVTGATDIPSLNGSISAKYNLTLQSSLFAGMGLRWLTPLAGSRLPSGYTGTKFDVDNPYINYQYLYRWADIQSAFVVNETFYTNANLLHDGYVTTLNLSQNNVYDIGHTGLNIGATMYLNLGYFDNNSLAAENNQADYAFGLVPSMEYRVSDKINLRTDSNLLSFQHLRSQRGGNTYQQQTWAQTFAVGYSITRDVYIYPGIQWAYGDMRLSRTATWVTTNINLF